MQLILALMVFASGLYFTAQLRSRPFRAIGALRRNGGAQGTLSPGAALASALCGTLGVGSVAAVVSALAQGGPGALVYLWLGALTGCALKYAEILVTMRHRKGTLSGAMVALREKSPTLGAAYALLCLPVALLGMGNLAQVQVLSGTLTRALEISPVALAGMVVVLLATLLAGGVKRIGRAASVGLPVMGGLYLVLCFFTLWRFRSALPGAFSAIWAGAMQPSPGLFTLGVARGLFISEAGLGTAAFAHSQSRAQPQVQAGLGVCEVLFSTFLCTVTALVVLVTGVPLEGEGTAVALYAFRAAMGPAGAALLCAMLSFFALSTLPVWWFYGRQCVCFLLNGRWPCYAYTALFLAVAGIGCLVPLEAVWRFADFFNLLLALPCLCMLWLYRKEIVV